MARMVAAGGLRRKTAGAHFAYSVME